MKTRRILSVVLAVMMVLTTFTFASVSVSAAVPEVYVDQTNGSDSNNGATPEKAVQTFNAAFDKVEEGGTIYIVGTYLVESGKQYLPSSESTKAVVVEGYDDTSRIETTSGLGVVMRAPMTFRNIKMFGGGSGHAHLNTYANKLVLGEGYVAEGNGQIHVGPLTSGTVPSVHLVIDGANVTKNTSIGGAYLTNAGHGITGDATVEVLSGTLDTLKLTQDGYADGHLNVNLGGNLNVRVAAEGKINKMVNSAASGAKDRSTIVKGYLQLILEGGATMPTLDLTNFNHKDYYEIHVADTTHGRVDFTSKAGVFNITADDGYVTKIEYDDYTTFVLSGEFEAPIGKVVNISFTNEKKIAPSAVDVIVTPATPGDTTWPVSVSDTEHFSAEVVSVYPEHTTVGYAIPYKYEITLAAKDAYVFPADFAFTINGSSEYRIDVVSESYDYCTFTYTAEMTEKDETRAMISYVGGIGTAGTAPYNQFADFNSQITVDRQYFSQGGYSFDGYSDGTAIYQPGDTYQLGTEDVVFTAVWTKLDKIQVVFNGGAATGGTAPDTLEDYEGKYVTIPECTYANTGYVFTCWTDESGKIYNPGDLVLLSGGNLYLTANWEVNPISGEKVYLDVLAGLDTNDGLAPETAVNTLAKAISLANGGNVTVIVIGNLSLNDTLPANDGNVTITGYDEDSALIINKSVALGSATNIENIKINAAKGAYIVTNGQKAVIGPNLENIGEKYDVVDGGVDTTVDTVDTVLMNGISLKTYYLGGAYLTDKTQGIDGNVNVTVDGADIEIIDFAPKGDDASTTATITGYIAFNVNGGNIGDFIASKAYVKNSTKPAFIFFNNGTIPVLDAARLKANLENGRPRAYVVDSGIGGAVTFYGTEPALNGRIRVTDDTTRSVWLKSSATAKFTDKTGEDYFNAARITTYYAKVRYGDAFTDDIAATVVEPTGGAEATSIVATPVDQSITDIVSIQLSGWDPELVNDKFVYETQYAVTVNISLAEGHFFNDSSLPAVILNGETVEATVNSDGTLSATYQFPEKTGIAPQLNVTYETGDPAVVGNPPAAEKWDHLSTNKLPGATSMSNLGYRFAGWKCSEDGVIYAAGRNYTLSGNTDVTFTAQWTKRGGWELPNVLILYDLSAYGRDKGRNPGFENDDEPILVTKPFANLEYEIDGKKSTVSAEFDTEKAVKIVSDGVGKAFTINDYTLNRAKADTHEYPHLTIIYYYQSESGAAVGDYGHINYGNVILADGSKSNWFGKPVTSKEPIVANKWACVTWDFTEFNAENSVPEGSIYNQFHISPIGTKSLADLKGDTLYLKAMYFSKYPAITK